MTLRVNTSESRLILPLDRFQGEGQTLRSIIHLFRVADIPLSRSCLRLRNAYQYLLCPVRSDNKDKTYTLRIVLVFIA
jgi:hypothetical protein